MSTRSRAKTNSAAAAAAAKIVPQQQTPKSSLTPSVQDDTSSTEKENAKAKNTTKTAKKQPARANGRKVNVKKDYCTCKKGDDGTPMVFCAECKDWYHFICVNLSERDAEDINLYVCPSCTEKTGLRTVMLWEGPTAVEEVIDSGPTSVRDEPTTTEGTLPQQSLPDAPSESENDPSSEDEYVAESAKAKGKDGGAAGKRRVRRLSFSDESDSSGSGDHKPSRRATKVSTSPGPSKPNHLKRKNTAQPPPSSKRQKSSDPTEDPARKYCLGKLEEVFRDIFLRYPHVPVDDDVSGGARIVEKKPEDLTEDEKAKVEDAARRFATDLEQCVYEAYSEPDKHGRPSAAGKYKGHFRMLQFNLSKVDRVVLHKRIVSGQLSPKEISSMSSTDLANEETKQHIKIAEQEALEHSILQKTIAPRAKITHKGFEDIEDLDGQVAIPRERDERERLEEERMERERLARLRAASQSQPRQRTASMSVPPESPVVAQAGAWGGPPAIPSHAMLAGDDMDISDPFGEDKPSLFVHTQPDFAPPEPELNLADLINIDDEPTSAQSISISSPSVPAMSDEIPSQSPAILASESSSVPTSPVGISPFAANVAKPPATPRTASFDLNSLWSAPASGSPANATPPDPSSPPPPSGTTDQEEQRETVIMMEPEVHEEADDRDFDMFLEEKERDAVLSPEELQAAFDASAQVWTGKINMPLDSTIPQETPVVARQMGGRGLDAESLLWRTLFPSELLRIDGRVPVDKSAQFLLQVRMNPAKELIGVAFSPANDADDSGFRILTDFLIAKGRHGLVFPWGNRPKDHAPGRELYIIPLLSSDPLPDYMELLDDLRLPKIRQSNYLIGMWILNKGKLAPPPNSQPPPPLPSAAAIPTAAKWTPNAQLLSLLQPQAVSNASRISGISLPPNVDPAALASEVAALTPEQIQLMLRTLGAAPIPPVVPAAQPPPPPPPAPVPAPAPIQMTNQPWVNPSYPPSAYPPVPPIGYPPMGYPGPPRPDSGQHNPAYPRPPYGRGEYRHDSHPGPGYDRGGDRDDRGWRGRGQGQGRGRGRGRGGDSPQGPVDSGWPRRRSDGRGGGPAASPSQRQWQ